MSAPDFDAVLRLHEADVTSWDAGDLHGCLCDNWDGRDWDEHRAHVVDALQEAMLSWLLDVNGSGPLPGEIWKRCTRGCHGCGRCVQDEIGDWWHPAPRDNSRPHKWPGSADGDVIAWRCQACHEWIDESGERTPCSVDWRTTANPEEST